MTEENIRIREDLKKKLPEKRYEHTLGVCYTAIAMAMRWEQDLAKAELAGLLHDCAKRWKTGQIAEECRKRGVNLTPEELMAPSVIHAKLGAFLAEHEYGVHDPEVLSAIACHTTGKPGMSTLDKIIYLADFIEPSRKMLDILPAIRKMCFVDLDEALFMTLDNILRYLRSTNAPIDSVTQETYDYYDRLRKEKR